MKKYIIANKDKTAFWSGDEKRLDFTKDINDALVFYRIEDANINRFNDDVVLPVITKIKIIRRK